MVISGRNKTIEIGKQMKWEDSRAIKKTIKGKMMAQICVNPTQIRLLQPERFISSTTIKGKDQTQTSGFRS